MRALNAVCNQSWAITPDYLRTIIEIAARENPTPEAVEAKLGRSLDNTHTVTMRDGVASIPVTGPLFRRANMFTRISGATSIGTLATDFQTALDDPNVRAIVLDIDSPGGEVNGTSEFAQQIFAARGIKPVVAYVSDLGCSAAYWIASAADEVVAADTARIGSIGVMMAVSDPSKGEDGANAIEFVSSQSPNKRLDPTQESGRVQMQAHVDALGQVFVNSVARNRGVSPETVLSDFGQGGIFVGQDAVDAGLADAVGTYEGLMKTLASEPGGGDVHVPVPLGPRRKKRMAAEDAAAQFAIDTGANTAATVSRLASAMNDYGVTAGTSGYVVFDTPSGPGQQTIAWYDEHGNLTSAPYQYAVSSDTIWHDGNGVPPTSDTPPAQETSMDTETITPTAQDLRIAELERTVAEAAAREKAAIERLATLETTKRHSEFASLAANWHGETDRFVAFMDGLDDEGRAFFTETMNALHAQVKEGALFAAAGVTGGVEAGSALAELEGMAASVRKANPALSREKAFTQAVEQNPTLYAQYLEQVGQNY